MRLLWLRKITLTLSTVEPQFLSETNASHTIVLDNQDVQIDEGNRSPSSMGYQVGDN